MYSRCSSAASSMVRAIASVANLSWRRRSSANATRSHEPAPCRPRLPRSCATAGRTRSGSFDAKKSWARAVDAKSRLDSLEGSAAAICWSYSCSTDRARSTSFVASSTVTRSFTTWAAIRRPRPAGLAATDASRTRALARSSRAKSSEAWMTCSSAAVNGLR